MARTESIFSQFKKLSEDDRLFLFKEISSFMAASKKKEPSKITKEEKNVSYDLVKKTKSYVFTSRVPEDSYRCQFLVTPFVAYGKNSKITYRCGLPSSMRKGDFRCCKKHFKSGTLTVKDVADFKWS